MTLLRDNASQPLHDLHEACQKIRELVSGLLVADAVHQRLADIEACGRDLEKDADRLAVLLAEAAEEMRGVFGRVD